MAAPIVENSEKIGLAFWMDRVLEEHAKLREPLPAEPVHDLRVALRRCILMAEVMEDVDLAGDWRMRKAARGLFSRLGTLRDAHVLMEWVERLGAPEEAATSVLQGILQAQIDQNRAKALEAARAFDRKQWRSSIHQLSDRFRRLAANRTVCEAFALEAWESVLDLHRHAQKSQSQVAYHRLRVRVKKFRYAIENLLPSQYPAWELDLKYVQDILGEIHDFDVLSQIIVKNKRHFDAATRSLWAKRLETERAARLQQYRKKMSGKSSPLRLWREGLPGERKLRSVGLAKLSAWGDYVTPDSTHVRKVSSFALQIYDACANRGLIGADAGFDERSILHAASLLQDVGHFEKRRAYHKESYRMIRKITPPVGWSTRDIEMVALVARFHRRALPHMNRKMWQNYPRAVRDSLVLLIAVLRLANAFSGKACRGVGRVDVEKSSGAVVVRAEGYTETDALMSKLAGARRLLEFACRRPVQIQGSKIGILSPQLARPAARSDAA